MFMSLIAHRLPLSFLIGILAEIFIHHSQQQEKRTVWHPDDEELNPPHWHPKVCKPLLVYNFSGSLSNML